MRQVSSRPSHGLFAVIPANVCTRVCIVSSSPGGTLLLPLCVVSWLLNTRPEYRQEWWCVLEVNTVPIDQVKAWRLASNDIIYIGTIRDLWQSSINKIKISLPLFLHFAISQRYSFSGQTSSFLNTIIGIVDNDCQTGRWISCLFSSNSLK